MYNDDRQVNQPYTTKRENQKRVRTKPFFKFKINDYVRLAFSRYTFQRDFQQKWTTEAFKVSERFVKENIPQYKVIDMLNQLVIGNFYKWEIMKTDKEQEFWRVETILKTRKKKGKKEYLIKWEGYIN